MVTRMSEPQKRNRQPKYKMRYRVKNWREYEQSLRDRGDITLWISQDAIDAWLSANDRQTRGSTRLRRYRHRDDAYTRHSAGGLKI